MLSKDRLLTFYDSKTEAELNNEEQMRIKFKIYRVNRNSQIEILFVS